MGLFRDNTRVACDMCDSVHELHTMERHETHAADRDYGSGYKWIICRKCHRKVADFIHDHNRKDVNDE